MFFSAKTVLTISVKCAIIYILLAQAKYSVTIEVENCGIYYTAL